MEHNQETEGAREREIKKTSVCMNPAAVREKKMIKTLLLWDDFTSIETMSLFTDN